MISFNRSISTCIIASLLANATSAFENTVIRGIQADGEPIADVDVFRTQSGYEYIKINGKVTKHPRIRDLMKYYGTHFDDGVDIPHRFLRDDHIDEDIAPDSTSRDQDDDEGRTKSSKGIQNISVTNSNGGRDKAWDLYKQVEDFKSSASYGNVSGYSRKVLTNFRYIVLPIWWSDESETDTNKQISRSQIDDVIAYTTDYYDKMSWGLHDLSWTVLSQVKINLSSNNPGFGDSEAAAKQKLSELGYTFGVDYHGICLVYNNSQNGPFSGSGGWGNVNSNEPFLWMSYPWGLGNSVSRHEVGHNYGHPHHYSYKYYWRTTKSQSGDWYDMYDMMSGGNGYTVSDMAVASKWFFGWVPDSAIVLMQPEGSNDNCQSCVSEGTFTLYPFDDWGKGPSVDNAPMGVHIPITGVGNNMYSYWLSYRTGNPAIKGLSVHLSWFGGMGGGFYGTSYDSLNYDVYGDTDTRSDSFLFEVGTCYTLDPSVRMLEVDPSASLEVIPKVCLDEIVDGQHVTVSVSFVHPDDRFPSQSNQTAKQSPNHTFDCSDSTFNTVLETSQHRLIQVKNTGRNGVVDVSLCPNTKTAAAYIYDFNPLYEDVSPGVNPESYGSHMSMKVTALDCCSAGTQVDVDGALAIKVTNNLSDFLHLNEIQVFDADGNNVAINGKCYSKNKGYGGDPNCLNDGVWGIYPDTCNSHSSWMDPGNYDYCVFDESVNIKRVVIYPWNDPTRTWMTNRIRDLNVEFFASVQLAGTSSVSFLGSLGSYRETRFSSSSRGPQEKFVTLGTTVTCPSNDPPSLSYQAIYDNAWILVKSDAPSVQLQSTCTINECAVGYKKSGNQCVECLSTDTTCAACPGGTSPFFDTCKLDESTYNIVSASGWRILAPDFHTSNGWAWDVKELKFYSSEDCTGFYVTTEGSVIESGNAGSGWGAQNAFQTSSTWGGRYDANKIYFLGKMFTSEMQVRCVSINQPYGHYATEVRVQAYKNNRWENVAIKKNMTSGLIEIPLSGTPASPSSPPSFSPSSSPSSTPVASPPSTVQIKNAASGNWCLTVKGAFNGAKTLIKKCSNTNALQKFVISNDTGLIRLKKNSAKCIKKVKNTMKVQPCAVTDPFKWTIQPYNGPFYWTKANLNKNVAVAGDTLGGGRGIVLATFNDNANSHKWRTVAI